jgi:uncharacterized protein (DUF924 family)
MDRRDEQATSDDPRIEDVLGVWFGDPGESAEARGKRWFMPDPAFDDALRRRFGDLLAEAARGKLDAWKATPRGALALVILLDQMSRNIFRGTPRAFAQDQRALAVARAMIATGQDRALSFIERTFVLLPFEHEEDREVQREAVAAFEALHAEAVAAGAPADELGALATGVDFARRHAVIIERFGRFPHRNAILERTSTGEEVEFLQQPGSRF